MKTLKTIALASVLAGGLTGLASAYTPTASTSHLYIVGAPAYRLESIATINYIVKTVYSSLGGSEIASSSATSDFSNTSAVVWVIPNFSGSGNDLEINASFTGSTAGVESVASNNGSFPQKFITDSNAGVVGTPVFGLSTSVTYTANISLSDTYQKTTPFINATVSLETTNPPSTSASGDGQYNNFTFNKLTGVTLGVEEYHWVVTNGAAARGFTNITTAQAQLLFKNGQLPLSYFTGKNSDETSYVYPLSRDPGSGSRLIALAETGAGVRNPIVTYKPQVSGAVADNVGNYVGGSISDSPYTGTFGSGSGGPQTYNSDVTANVSPGQVPSTLLWDDNSGDLGYPKFGTADQTGELAAITSKPTDPNAFYVTYLDSFDAAEAETPTSVDSHNKYPVEELTYNGVSAGGIVTGTTTAGGSSLPTSVPNQTAQIAAVAEGGYDYWSLEQAYVSSNVTSGTPQATFIGQIESNFPSFANVPYTALQVGRTVDGAPVTPNY